MAQLARGLIFASLASLISAQTIDTANGPVGKRAPQQ